MSDEYLRELLRAQTEHLEHVYQAAVEQGRIAPVAFLLDLRDETAKRIAVGWSGQNEVDRILSEPLEAGGFPVISIAVDEPDVARAFRSWPEIMRFLAATVRPDHFKVLVFSENSLMCITRPIVD